MYEELTRNMNDQERAMLNKLSLSTYPPVTFAETIKWLAVWAGGILLCGLAATGLIILEPHPVIGGIIGAPIALAGIVCLYAIIMLVDGYFRLTHHHRDFVRGDIPEIKAALDDGQVFVKKVSAEAVIEIVEFEDEGSGYIYDVGDGKILFLKGQRFYPVNDDMSWPNSKFEIVRTVHGDMWVGIFCSGVQLTAIREIKTSECADDIVWADREDILDGDIEQFAKSITKAA